MDDNEDRRAFCTACIYGIWALIGMCLAVPSAAYLLFPPRARKSNDWVEVADIGQFHPNAPEEVVFRRNRVDGWKITSEKTTAWVVKQTGGELVAFAPQCTHLGCAYHWDEKNKNFLCPCHTSTFAMDGTVLTGPAPRALDRYEAKIEQGKLMLGGVQPQVDVA